MKKLYYIKTAFLSLASMAMLSSCLKDNTHFVNFAGSIPLVELPAATGVGPGGGFVTPIALPIQSAPQVVDLLVNLAAPKPLTTALTVKLTIDAAALTAYNTAQAAAYTADSTAAVASGSTLPSAPTYYTLMPASFYTISSLTVTIPANQNSVNLHINVTTLNFDLTKNYVIPFTIIDGGGQQISNYKTVFYYIQPKNKYDGIYKESAYALRLGDPILTGHFSGVKIPLSTSGANSVSFNQFFGDGATTAGGIEPVNLTVNADNSVTVTSAANPTLANAIGYNSRYVPSTNTFYVSFTWSTPGTRAATDTLVYSGPR